MYEYRVQIEIDVDADDEPAAARRAWDLLKAIDADDPVCDVFPIDRRGHISGKPTQIDLSKES